jgi:hypothetical protein
MSSFIRAACALLVVAIANFIFWPPNDVLVKHKPQYENTVRITWFERNLVVIKPKIVFLGNSIMDEAIDEREFSRLTATQTIKIWYGGSASAWWYLALKNVILKAPHKPQIVVLFFRDHFLTDPTYRATGKHKQKIDAVAEQSEPVLDRLTYLDNMNAVIYLLFRYCPLYQQRDKIKNQLETIVKDRFVCGLTGLEQGMPDRAIERLFDEKNLNKELLTIRQIAAESAGSNELYNFPQELDRSFLPHMIKMSKQNNIQLVFVRTKRRRDVEPNKQPKALQKYIKNLEDYLAKNRVVFIDFTDDKRIKIEHYGSGDHLSRSGGRQLFTKILTEKMLPIIQNLDR